MTAFLRNVTRQSQARCVIGAQSLVIALLAAAFACTPLKEDDLPTAADAATSTDGMTPDATNPDTTNPDATSTGAACPPATQGPDVTYPNAKIVTGDFDGDGWSDIALVGGAADWRSLPVAFARAGTTFELHNNGVDSFPSLAREPNVRAVVGDYDGDGRSDIALVGGSTWTAVPMALSRGAGNFDFRTSQAPEFARPASAPGTTVLAADLDSDGHDDLVLVGSADGTVRYALSGADASFKTVAAVDAGWFGASVPQGPRIALVGDCGRLAGSSACSMLLFGGAFFSAGITKPWETVAIGALPHVGDPSLVTLNDSSPAELVAWTQRRPIETVAGDFDGNGSRDVAVFRADSKTVSIAYSGARDDGSRLPQMMRTTSVADDALFTLECADGAVRVAGDFDGDTKTDIAVLGAIGWTGISLSTSSGDGSFHHVSVDLPDFAIWASGHTGAR